MAIKIILSAANMGDVDEIDFDCWAGFVNDRIDDVVGATVVVGQFRFGEASEDQIEGATDAQRDAIRGWLGVDGWNEFCGEEWTSRRAAKEAA